MAASGPPAEGTILRKVTASGVIWLDGRAYYISRRLTGRTVAVKLGGGKLVVDVTIPLHREYSLPGRAVAAPLRPPRATRPGRREQAG